MIYNSNHTNPNDHYVLSHINLTIPSSNYFMAIVGPTGCGKTTLFKLLCQFYRPTKGNIYTHYYTSHANTNNSSNNVNTPHYSYYSYHY